MGLLASPNATRSTSCCPRKSSTSGEAASNICAAAVRVAVLLLSVGSSAGRSMLRLVSTNTATRDGSTTCVLVRRSSPKKKIARPAIAAECSRAKTTALAMDTVRASRRYTSHTYASNKASPTITVTTPQGESPSDSSRANSYTASPATSVAASGKVAMREVRSNTEYNCGLGLFTRENYKSTPWLARRST